MELRRWLEVADQPKSSLCACPDVVPNVWSARVGLPKLAFSHPSMHACMVGWPHACAGTPRVAVRRPMHTASSHRVTDPGSSPGS